MSDAPTMTMPANGHKRLQDRVPLEEITADAKQARPGRALAALVGGIIFALAFLCAKIFRVLFFAGAWCASAWKMGWRQAMGRPLNQPSMEAVLRENDMLRAQLERIQVS